MSTANTKHAGNRRKLTRAEKKEIAALIRAAKGDGKAHTAQQTIPYLAMYPDGICKITEKKYSKSTAYDDINYQRRRSLRSPRKTTLSIPSAPSTRIC